MSVVDVAILADENSSRRRLTRYGLVRDLESTNEKRIDTVWYGYNCVLPFVTA